MSKPTLTVDYPAGSLADVLTAKLRGTETTITRTERQCGWVNGDFVVLSEVPAGTTVTIDHFTNMGFGGIVASVTTADGRRLNHIALANLGHEIAARRGPNAVPVLV